MIAFSQNNKAWANMLIGSTNLTMRFYGCYIVSLAILLGYTPDALLKILNRNNCFNKEGALLNDIAAVVLGCSYKFTTENPKKDCVGETDNFKKQGVPQHFFVVLKNSIKIIDPLDGTTKTNPYKVVSYRIWEKIKKDG